MSNQYPVNKSYGDKNDCYHRGDHHNNDNCCNKYHSDLDCEPEKVIFKCNNTEEKNVSVKGNASTDEITIGTIVAKGLGCFKKPCIRLDTSAVISAKNSDPCNGTDDITVLLEYKIYKCCDNDHKFKEIKSITTPSMEVEVDTGYTLISQVPSIYICEETCKKECCCKYKVTIKATVSNDYYPKNTTSINISQGIISVIATEGSC